MNLVGKICVLVIFILSLVFMSFSLMVYSTHRNWKEAADSMKSQRDTAQAQNDQLKRDLEALTGELAAEKAAYQQNLAKLETERGQLLTQRDEMQQRLAQMVGQNRELTGTVGAAQQRLTNLIEEVGQLRANIIAAQQQRDQSFDAVVAKTEDLHQTHAELTRAKERETQLVEQVARYTQRMQEEGVDPGAQPKGALAPKIDGLVTAIGQENLIEVSVGADDGLRAGQTLEVFRGASYLGRAEIVRTSPDRAVAKILRQYRRGPIQKGDRVATRLKIS